MRCVGGQADSSPSVQGLGGGSAATGGSCDSRATSPQGPPHPRSSGGPIHCRGSLLILPVLGLWMLPLGLLLLAHDVPFLRKPVGRFTSWGAQRWAKFRGSNPSEKGSIKPEIPDLPPHPTAVTSAPDSKPTQPIRCQIPNQRPTSSRRRSRRNQGLTSRRPPSFRALRPHSVHLLGHITLSDRQSPLKREHDRW